MVPVDSQNFAIPGAIPPKWEKTCLRCRRTTVQNFTPIGKVLAEKSVTVQNEREKATVNLASRLYYVWRDNQLQWK